MRFRHSPAAACIAVAAALLLEVDNRADAAQQKKVELPAGFSNDLLIEGLNKPIDFVFLPDDRILIAGKKGTVSIADISRFPIEPTTYLQLTDCFNWAERGLLGIVLDPDFENNPYIYIYVSTNQAPRIRVSRYRHVEAAGSVAAHADPDSEKVIWGDDEGYVQCCHYGGSITFGPDQMLYITTGDKSNASLAQDLYSSAGKIHRVSRDGQIPADNMGYRDGHGGIIDSIWAYGLRNPLRGTWDLIGGAYLIGDVGSNIGSASWEEVNLGLAGKNFGWPLCEGECGAERPYDLTCDCVAGVKSGRAHESPLFSYRHSGRGGAVIGGFVYRPTGRPTQFPMEYHGTYFYADYSRSMIGTVKFSDDFTTVESRGVLSTLGGSRPASMKQGPHDAMYFADFQTESIRRIMYIEQNEAPRIVGFSTSATKTVDLSAATSFSAVTENDFNQETLLYTWVFGDGHQKETAGSHGIVHVKHTYTRPGRFLAYLIVSDLSHSIRSETVPMIIGHEPVAKIVSPVDLAVFTAGQAINLEGKAFNDAGEELTGVAASYSWDLYMKHDYHLHPIRNDVLGPSHIYTAPNDGHEFYGDVTIEIELTVTTGEGLVSVDRVNIQPDEYEITFRAVGVPESTVYLSGIPYAMPQEHDVFVGFGLPVSATGTFCHPDTLTERVFDYWQTPQGKKNALSHTFNVPQKTSARMYTAHYKDTGANCTLAVVDIEIEEGVECTRDLANVATTTITCVPCFDVLDVAPFCTTQTCDNMPSVEAYCAQVCPGVETFYATMCSDVDKRCPKAEDVARLPCIFPGGQVATTPASTEPTTLPSYHGSCEGMHEHGHWQFKDDAGCGGSQFNNECYSKNNNANYFDALDFCTSNGARLCTEDEILSSLTRNSGCGLDKQMVWTSTACGDTHFRVAKGKGGSRGMYSCQDASNAVYGARCCSDPYTTSTTSTSTLTTSSSTTLFNTTSSTSTTTSTSTSSTTSTSTTSTSSTSTMTTVTTSTATVTTSSSTTLTVTTVTTSTSTVTTSTSTTTTNTQSTSTSSTSTTTTSTSTSSSSSTSTTTSTSTTSTAC